MFGKEKKQNNSTPEEQNESVAAAAEAEEQTVDPVAEKEALIKRCQEEICPACTVKTEADDVRLRALAEMENFKKRLQRDKDEQVKYAAEDVIGSLVPVLDNLDLAIQYGGTDPACKNMLMGIEMTRKIFLDILKTHGLTTVGEVGDEFNPEIHEAVSQETSDTVEPGRITVLHQRGYRLKERLIRPAKVCVSQKAQ